MSTPRFLPLPARRAGVFFALILTGWLVAGAIAPALHAADPVSTGPRSGKWAHEGPKQTLTPDPRVTWGRLDNGFRYALLPHKGVPDRISMQLIVLSGALDETPQERGIAHYTEHMAFGGTKNFLPGQMIQLFQRLGVEYGSDVNAVTTWGYTQFRLDFRERDPGAIREGLRLFRDFGDGLTFPPETIERERKVVLAELRNHHTLADARADASLPVVFKGLKFPERSPGGDEKQIAHFTREQFLNFYHRNYRPDLMVLVVAGDFDPAAMNGLVRELFSPLEKRTDPIPVRDDGKFDGRAMRAGVFWVSGVGSASTEAASVTPLGAPGKPDSREDHVERQRRELVASLFGERVHSELREMGADADYDEMLGYGVASVSGTVDDKEWKDGVVNLDRMVRLTLERGFDQGEIEVRRKRELESAAHMLDQIPTLDPGILCDALCDSITDNHVFIGLEQNFAWHREWLQHFNAEEAKATFRRMWNVDTMAYQVAGSVDLELTPQKVIQAVEKSRRGGVNYVLAHPHKDTPFVLPHWGNPGTVAERKEVPEFNAQLVKFANNVRFNFISSKQEPGLVRAMVRVGTGLIDLPGNKPALKDFGTTTLLASGGVHFPPEQLGALVDERLMDFAFDVSDRDAFSFHGLMPSDQVETFLGLVTDFLYEPQLNSFANREEKMRAIMGRMAGLTGMGDGLRELTNYLFKGDPRFTWGEPLDYISNSITDVRKWMIEPLAHGYVEVTIVGDLSEETATRAMARTLGTLATRAATKTPYTKPQKPVEVTAKAGFNRIEFIGEQNMGLVVGTWPVMGAVHVRDQAALEVLGKILEIRVRTEVREKLGLAYSPSAAFQSYDGFPGFALLQAHIDVSPDDSSRVAPVITAIGAQLAKDGVEEGEFIGARGILKSQIKSAFRENGYLLETLMRAQERPEEFAELAALHGNLMDTVTREEVNKWAAQVLVAGNARTTAVVPKAFVGVFDAIGAPGGK